MAPPAPANPPASPAPRHLLLLALSLLLTAAAYWPGLAGGFVFDDWGNLDALGAFGPVDNPRTLLYYLSSGSADPLGRPVAMASFLLDARDWPADPWPFKRTNLLLHLLNGALLYLVLRRLERRLAPAAANTGKIALLAATLWMAHPLFVSTTLYVVQRQAMLPLSFLLTALLCWDRAYDRLLAGRTWTGLIWTAVGVGASTLLAALSKANGLLTPMLVWLAVWLIYRPDAAAHGTATQRRVQWTAAAVLAPPTFAVIVYLLQRIPGKLARAGSRDFTLAERLLSQPRALLDYLELLLIPRAGSAGLYADDFAVSHSLWAPWTTLPSLLAVMAMLAAAVLVARRLPRVAFAILFFFAAHSVESSTIMLELYFEHRNYLPAAFLFWPLAHWLASSPLLPRVRQALTWALPALLLLISWQRAIAWGDPALQAALWGQRNPASLRSQSEAAIAEADRGQPQQAIARLRRVLDDTPLATDIAFNLIGIECAAGGVSADTLARTAHALARGRALNLSTLTWLRRSLQTARHRPCRGLDAGAYERLLDAVASNPRSTRHASRRRDLFHIQGQLALLRGRPEEALDRFDRALAERPDPELALQQAADLGNAGFPGTGALHLDRFFRDGSRQPVRVKDMRSLHRRILEADGYYRREWEHLRAQLLQAEAEMRR